MRELEGWLSRRRKKWIEGRREGWMEWFAGISISRCLLRRTHHHLPPSLPHSLPTAVHAGDAGGGGHLQGPAKRFRGRVERDRRKEGGREGGRGGP